MAGTTTASRSRIAFVAAALVLLLEGGSLDHGHGKTSVLVDAFVLPSSPLTGALLPGSGGHEAGNFFPLRSFRFIKGESSYGDVVDGTVNAGMMGGLGGGTGSVSLSGFGSNSRAGRTAGSNRMGGNSLLSGSRRTATKVPQWWTARSGFSRKTPTTLLAKGSVESWPVLEADDIQILVKKGEDIEDELNHKANRKGKGNRNDRAYDEDDYEYQEYDEYGNPVLASQQPKEERSSVRATLERWERDISLEVVGRDGYPMAGNQMQPGGGSNAYADENSDRCTQKIDFSIDNGDLYPFSGTVSVPPPLTVEDSMGNQQTVMMVLNNPDEDGDDYGGGDFGFTRSPGSKKGKTVEAKLEPLYKSPDEKYAAAQRQQQQQYEYQYDEYGNEIYDPSLGGSDEETATIPARGYQSFQLDATDPASGKIKISLERERAGNGFGGGASGDVSEARLELYHGFRDEYGNYHSPNPEEDDRRFSLDVSTMHPEFSSVVDTMPAELLARHSLLPHEARNYDPRRSQYQPYLEVRIVNTGGASLKAGVGSFMPYYKPQSQKLKEELRRRVQRQATMGAAASLRSSASEMKADDPFLLVDSAQSSTSSRRIKENMYTKQTEAAYVSGNGYSSNRNSNVNGNNFNNNFNSNYPNQRSRYGENYVMENDSSSFLQGFGGNSNGFMGSGQSGGGGGVRADVPGGASLFGGSNESRPATRRYSMFVSSRDLGYYNGFNDPNNDSYLSDRSPMQQTPSRRRKANGYHRNGMGTSFNDRVPEHPVGPESGVIDTVATSGGRSSGSSNLALASFGGNGGSVSGMQGRQQQRQQQPFGSQGSVIGDGVINGRSLGDGNEYDGYGNNGFGNGRPMNGGSGNNRFGGNSGSYSERNSMNDMGNSNRRFAGNRGGFGRENSMKVDSRDSPAGGSFAGNGRVIGDGIIKGRPTQPGFQGFSSSGGMTDGRADGFGTNTNSFAGTSGGGSTNNINGPFGNMGRPPPTTANSKNPFATLNGETGGDNNSFGASTNDFGSNESNNLFGGSTGSSNSFGGSRQTNGFGSNDDDSNAFGGGMGSPQRPLGGSSAMKNPFSGLNGNANANGASGGPFGNIGGNNQSQQGGSSSPFGNIGSPSTTAMRSNSNNYGEYDEQEGSSDGSIMGFAKNFVKGFSG